MVGFVCKNAKIRIFRSVYLHSVSSLTSLEAQILIQWACKRVEDERYAFDCTSNRPCSSVQHLPLRRFLELLVVRTSFVPLSSIIRGESRQTVSGSMKTPFLKNYMPDVKLCRSQPFSGAIADTSRQEGRLPWPFMGSNKENYPPPHSNVISR